jgi:hypothetical protein
MAAAIPQRGDERGQLHTVDVANTSHALLKLEGGDIGVIPNSWATPARRDGTMWSRSMLPGAPPSPEHALLHAMRGPARRKRS